MKLSYSLLFVFALAACDLSNDSDSKPKSDASSASQARQLAERQILRKGNGAEPQTLDPHKAEGVPSSNILRDLFEGLVAEAPDGSIVPGVASSWESNRDGTNYTFHLREQAAWSNGDAVTAYDFVYGLRRSVDPGTGSKYSLILSPILHAEAIIEGSEPVANLGVSAIDDRTLQIKLKAATPYFLALLAHSTTYPVHQESLEIHGSHFARPGKLITNGAYILKDWVVQSHISLVRNTSYWNNADTVIDEVVYYATEDTSAELKRYRAGEIDWTETVPFGQIRWIKENLEDELKIYPYLGTYYYGFNLTKPPFKDNLALRKALSLAIDREIIAEKIVGFGDIPAYGWVPPGLLNYTPQVVEYQQLNRQQRHIKAKKLFHDAGYSKNNQLTIQLRYNTSENHKKVAIAVASMWKSVLGVRTELVNEEWKVFLENRKQKEVTQVFRAGWIGDYNDPFSFAELMHSKHGINDSGYANPVYDALLDQASTEPNMDKRRTYLEQAERFLLKDQPIIPIYFYVSRSLIKPYVEGFVGNIMDHHYTKNIRILAH